MEPRLRTRMEQNKPNPFNPATAIDFEVWQSGHIEITVYDSAGRLVRRLLDQFEAAGEHTVWWDGRDDHGLQLSSGLYFYQLRAASERTTRKMVLLK